MFKQYLPKFLLNTITIGFGFLIFGLWYLAFLSVYMGIAVGFIFMLAVSYATYESASSELKKKHLQELNTINEELNKANKDKELARNDESLWKKTLTEKTSGFPSLIETIQEYEKVKDDYWVNYLVRKSHPAYTAAEVVKTEAQRRRQAEFENKKTKAIIEYYELIAPFLLDLKDDVVDIDSDLLSDYSEEERQDAVVNYLSKEEYRKLPSVERNQIALDRFWKRPKSKRMLGRLYERYVGYLYEMQGYDVDYVGIFKGYEDLGRDLICIKGNKIIIIQCKNWSQFKTIYEKHIFQFFGTVFQYKDSTPNKDVESIFYTTTQISELARRFAEELGIGLKENFKFDQKYPCIKCNINKATKEKIYHLPFDQQYDNTKIFEKGEFYCCTTKEAEDKGFRRAFRWHGPQQNTQGS